MKYKDSMIMELEKLKEIVTPIFSRNRVKRALLFGSSARGTAAKKSDLDFLNMLDSDQRFFDKQGKRACARNWIVS
jgi:predicted nucleotidyltransferase